MGVFDSLKKYAGNWNVIARMSVESELGDNLNDLVSTEVVPSEYGISVKFNFKKGYSQFIPVSKEDDKLEIGDTPSIDGLEILRLHRDGDEDIYKIMSK
jgi:hypothetical protein